MSDLTPAELPELSRLLDVALDLPEEDRLSWAAGLGGAEGRFGPLLARLLDPGATIASEPFLTQLPSLGFAGADPLDQLDGGPGPQPGAAIGPYTLERELGRGGMGAVWLAARSDGAYRGQVALKLPFPHLLAGHSRGRFRRERDILAGLQHANIARFLDAGIAEGGQPYLALEWVEGLPITEACRQRRLPLGERLALILEVAAAVHYAHGRLIVHRDIKPSNVLVTTGGRVQLLDFGIAKLLDATEGAGAAESGSGSGQLSRSQLTAAGESIATPDYAAPEQLLLGAITVATDVYTIGLLLYELLAGRRPPPLISLPSFPHLSAADEAPLVSRAVVPGHGASFGSEGQSDRQLAKALSGDLDAILAKALSFDPAARYASAEALAADLERYLRSEPIAARPIGRLAIAGKFIRRHRIGVSFAAALVLAILIGAGAVLWQSAQTAREARRAAATRDFLIRVLQGGDPRRPHPGKPGERTARELVDLAAARIGEDLPDDGETRFELLDLTSTIYIYLDEIERARPMVRRAVEEAEKLFPADHPRLLDIRLFEIWTDLQAGDSAATEGHLRDFDAQLRELGLDRSRHRAESLLARGDLALLGGDLIGREAALRQAAEIFAAVAPEESGYAATLANLGNLAFGRGELENALGYFERALAAVEEHAAGRAGSELEVARLRSRHGRILLELGRYPAARAELEAARAGFAATLGEGHLTAWQATAALGRLECLEGRQGAAEALFATIPPPRLQEESPGHRERAAEASILHGLCLAGLAGREQEAEGMLAEAAAILAARPAGRIEYAADLARAEAARRELSRRPSTPKPPARQ